MPERRIEYQKVSHKSDTGYLVTAPSLERLYIDAALALTDQLVALDLIDTSQKRSLSVSADNPSSLMAKWLSEILNLFEKEKILCRRIVFNQFDGKKLTATVFGQIYAPLRHGHVAGLLSISSEKLQMGDNPNPEPHFFARVFLDSV